MPLAPPNPVEEDDEDVPVAPLPVRKPKPLIGTTGGVIPEQQSDIDARTPVQWSPDPTERRAQIESEIQKRRQADFQKENPFTPSSWQQKINTPETRQQDREFAGQAEEQFQYGQQQARAAEIERRRGELAQRNARNNQLEAQYRGSGQQFYTDADHNLQPVIEADTGRPLFNPSKPELVTHPKTGKPALMTRDKYGQRQFKEPPVVQSLDPMDDQMHYKLPDGSMVPAGSIDDFAKSPNYAVAKAALAAKTRQVKAIHQEALQPMRLMTEQAASQLEDAKVEMKDLDSQIDDLTTKAANATAQDGSPTPLSEGLNASLEQLKARRGQLDGMVKPRGELAQKAARAKAGFAIASATAMREAHLAQQAEIAARVKAEGGNLENDPTYQGNLSGLRTSEQIIADAQQHLDSMGAPPQQPRQFETPLNAADEDSFQRWKQQNAPNDSGVDYDLRGAFKAGATPDANGHWPDTFKKPNHPTFSNQSIYASAAPEKAGRWDGNKFIPPASPSPLEQSEPYVALKNGIKNVGSVKMDEFARRYGDGRGPVQPMSLLKLDKRSKDIDATLANSDTSVNQTMRDQMTKEKDYIDSLFKQRFARLDPEQQKKVVDATRDPTIWDKIKGAGKSLAEEAAVGGGSVLKGIAQLPLGPMGDMEGGQVDPEIARKIAEANATPLQRMENIKNNPAYQLGSFIQDSAREAYAKNPKEDEGTVSKALNAAFGAAGGFAPLVASGGAAPLTMGFQTAGEEMERIYNEQVAKGVDPERAADFAQKRSLASGAVQAALFEVLPKPLQKAANKVIVDKIAGNALKKFVANRLAQGAEGAVLGGTTTAAENVTTGRDIGEGVPQSAAGLALMQGVMPRAKPEAGAQGEAPPPPSGKTAPLAPNPPAPPAPGPEAGMNQRKVPADTLDKVASIAERKAHGTPEEQAAADAEFAQMEKDHAQPNPADAKIDEINQGIRENQPPAKNETPPASEPAPADTKTAAPAQDSSLTSKVSAMTGEQFGEWEQANGGQTGASNKLGISLIGKPAEIAELKKANEAAKTEWSAAFQEAQAAGAGVNPAAENKMQRLASKQQFFEEAISAAEGTGSGLQDPEVVAAHKAAPVDIGPRDATVSTGTGVHTPKETAMMADWKKQNAAELATAPKASPLGDQPVKLEVRRGKTGETMQVEMPAKMAEKRINDHISTLEKVLNCLKGVT